MKATTRFQIGSGGLVYLVVAALIAAAAFYTQANLLFWSFGLMVGGLVASVALSWLSLRHVTVRRLLPSHGVAGDAMAIGYAVTNHKRWTPMFNVIIRERWRRPSRWALLMEGLYAGGGGIAKPPALIWRLGDLVMWRLKGATSAGLPYAITKLPDHQITRSTVRLRGTPYGWMLHVGPGQTIQAEAPAWPVHRGALAFDTVELSTAFPFGVVRRVLRVEQPGRVLVYPRLRRLHRRFLSMVARADGPGQHRIERAGGAEEFFGLRPYRSGDSPRLIDWKRTARTGELVTREMTHPSLPRVMVVLDLSGPMNSDAAGEPARTRARFVGRSLWRAVAQRAVGVLKAGALLGKTASQRRVDRQADEVNRREMVERSISLAASIVCDAHFHGYHVGLTVLGVKAPAFAVHHSPAHRTGILEALAQLDAEDRASEPGPVTVAPVVRITPGPAEDDGSRSHPRSIVISAAQMDRYVLDGDGMAPPVGGPADPPPRPDAAFDASAQEAHA